VERPQIDARPARPDHEVEAPPRRRAVELNGKVGLELTRERGDADGRADVRGYGDGDVAVVAGEAVAAILADGAAVGDVAVDGARGHAAGVDALELDVAVHVLDGDVAGDVAHDDVVVGGDGLDAAARVLDVDAALDGVELQASGAAAD